MNDMNELWSSPWRKLQKNLANGFELGVAGRSFRISEPPVPGLAIASGSWLMRARSRLAQVSPPLP